MALIREDYLKLKEAVRLSDRNAHSHKQPALLEKVEAECSPQQKGAIYKMLRQREDDWYLREASGGRY